MSNPDRTPQEYLRCAYFSRQIEQMELLHPEFRLELVDGQFLVGGTIEGSRWLLKEALRGLGFGSSDWVCAVDRLVAGFVSGLCGGLSNVGGVVGLGGVVAVAGRSQ
jgi:hypothetical protein